MSGRCTSDMRFWGEGCACNKSVICRLSYTEVMKHETAMKRLDVRAMALAAQTREGQDLLLNYERLAVDLIGLKPDSILNWTAKFSARTGASGKDESWLQLDLATSFPMVCQRCLTAVDFDVLMAREFRFVASEAVAEEEDDDCEEDLLVQSREFDLGALIEDELVMALPLIPRHDTCPVAVPMSAADAGFDDAASQKPNPFAALAGVLKAKS